MRCSKIITALEKIIDQRDERIAELEDRLQSNSLAELRAVRPVAMPLQEEQPRGRWLSDPTGMTREWVPDSELPDSYRE